MIFDTKIIITADTYFTVTYGSYMAYPKYVDNIHTDFGAMPIEHIWEIKKYLKKA